tara:strand:+ start:5912 stop:6484 length:573 start_codon:yes stop_codon:yes gene_type:complete
MILRAISISLLLLLSADYISCQEFDFLHLKDKNRSSIERAGDLFQIAIPIAGLSYTYFSDDAMGRGQFWKSFLSSLSLTYALKHTIDKRRPNGHCCESFPSGHTAAAFSGAMFIQNRYGYKYGVPSIILASYVGYSRVYAKKHYWEDVFVGALISTVSSIIFTDRIDDNYSTSISLSPFSNKLSINLFIN